MTLAPRVPMLVDGRFFYMSTAGVVDAGGAGVIVRTLGCANVSRSDCIRVSVGVSAGIIIGLGSN